MSETLEQAALSHASKAIISHRESTRNFTQSLSLSFKNGAEWQKEQYKELLSLAAMAASTLQDEGDTTTANEIIKEIERLQSI